MELLDFGKAMGEMHAAYGWEYIYRQLAEECAELSHACLKLVRAVNKETPVPLEEAAKKYIEEVADVWLMIAVARTDMTPQEKALFDQIVENKFNRMMERIKERNEFRPLKGCCRPKCSCADMAERMEDDLK